MSTFDDMVSFIKAANPARKYIVPCLEGPTGIGKTAACKQAAAELAEEGKASGKVVTIIASQILPNEVSGITMPVAETKAMEIFDHFRLGNLKDGDILFFDELLEADQLVLSACLTLIESRELMSGRKLPDVMIVAATNPTVKPSMLKENIRQRFVWRKFEIDRQGCRDYIKLTCGFDIGRELALRVTSHGDEYNILTPRTMTKMAQWISSADDNEQRICVAEQIDNIWNNLLGTNLLHEYNKSTSGDDTQSQVWKAVRSALEHQDITPEAIDDVCEGMGSIMYNEETFKQTSITELMKVLEQLPGWDKVVEELSVVEVETPEVVKEVKF